MRTPIRNPLFKSKSSFLIEQLIPVGSVIDSFCFFSGDTEFHLANRDRFVSAHTEKDVIKDVWETIFTDPFPVSEIASRILPLEDDKQFSLLQEEWSKFRNPDVRAALFYLLNNCSDSGFVSKGAMDVKNYNPVSLSRLKKFVKPDNFHLTKVEDTIASIRNSRNDVIYAQIPRVNRFFLTEGINRGLEEEDINIEMFSTALKDKKYVLITEPSDYLRNYFNCETIMIDEYGRETTNPAKSKEIILHNV